MKNIQNYLITILYIGLSAGILIGQPKDVQELSQAMQVGDTFVAPKAIQLMRGNTKKIDWKKLENKVVLLDFFETSCLICIQTMPKFQKLKEDYPDKFEVITVTVQSKRTMERFFASNTFLKEHQVNLPVIYGDSYLKGLFPHRSVPHAVLLYKGKVQAITFSGFITEADIMKLYEEGNIDLPLKDDFGKRELLSSSNDIHRKLKLGTLITGYQDGIPYRSFTYEMDSIAGLYKSSMYNTSIYSALLGLAAKVKMKKTMYIPRMDRVICKVKDSKRYHNFENLEEEVWMLDHAICYERFDTILRIDSLQARIILDDFATFYGLKVSVGTKKMECLVLNLCPIKPYKRKEGSPVMSYSNSTVFAGFTDLSEKFPPVVDKVSSRDRMEISAYENLEELNEQLANYGIRAELGMEEIEVLIIEEID